MLIVDDLSTGSRANVQHLLEGESVEFIEGTMVDEDLIDRCMKDVDACFHLASAVGVKLIMDEPLDSLLRNMRGNDVVISSAARYGRRLLFTSTSEVYGKNSEGAVSELSDRLLGSPFKVRWAYAESKALGESLANAYYREQGLPVVVARVFNTVGPRQTGAYGMVLPTFVRQALAGDDLTVYGNGTQSRCFCHVTDVVDALIRLSDAPQATGAVYNVGSSTEIPIIELARRVIDRVGSDSKIKLIPYKEAYGSGFEEMGRRQPNTTALQELTGWRSTRTVDDAIDDVAAMATSGDAVRGGRTSLAG